jgi:hypothetical protein
VSDCQSSSQIGSCCCPGVLEGRPAGRLCRRSRISLLWPSLPEPLRIRAPRAVLSTSPLLSPPLVARARRSAPVAPCPRRRRHGCPRARGGRGPPPWRRALPRAAASAGGATPPAVAGGRRPPSPVGWGRALASVAPTPSRTSPVSAPAPTSTAGARGPSPRAGAGWVLGCWRRC